MTQTSVQLGASCPTEEFWPRCWSGQPVHEYLSVSRTNLCRMSPSVPCWACRWCLSHPLSESLNKFSWIFLDTKRRLRRPDKSATRGVDYGKDSPTRMETHRSINESTWHLHDVLGADRAGGDWSTWQHHQGGVCTSKALTALQWMSQLQKSFTLERYSTDVVLAWWLSASKAHAYFQLIRLLFVFDGTKVFYISYSSAAYLNHFLANPLVLHERGGMVDKRLHMFAFVRHLYTIYCFQWCDCTGRTQLISS